jgi:hypothetical protein
VHWSVNPDEREGTEVVKEEKEFRASEKLLTEEDDSAAHKSGASFGNV